METNIYLDNSATTPLRAEVLNAIAVYKSSLYGNPSSVHHVGRQSRTAIEIARQRVANLIGAKPEEVYFTPSGTYANNVALLGRARYIESQGLGRHLITTGIEHSSSLGPAKHLESQGWKVTVLDVDREGFVSEADLLSAITSDTSIISIMWANNEVGTIQNIARFAQIARDRGIFFHTDAVQAAGKININVSIENVDTLSITGHKLHAPKGIGALYIRSGVTILPIVFGGGQEEGLFPGTESLTNIIALGAAAEVAKSDLTEHHQHLRKLQTLFLEKFNQVPFLSLTGALDVEKRIPGHISLVVDGAIGEEVVIAADKLGIAISSVSACSSGHPSHVLRHMGYSHEDAQGCARISASSLNTIEECEVASDALLEIFRAGSSFSNSPFGNQNAAASNVIDFNPSTGASCPSTAAANISTAAANLSTAATVPTQTAVQIAG